MPQKINYDLAIIGGGSGGLSLAAGAAQLGVKVVLFEANKMGGDCLNYGCVPSKSLLAAAKAAWNVKQANYFGVETGAIKIDFAKVMQHVQRTIATIEVNDSVARFEKLGVTVIQAPAQFINQTMLQAGDQQVQTKYCVIATGSSPFIPPIPGLDKIKFYTNETIFALTQQPKHLIVIGGGPIGCELAQAFALLGTQVTILEAFKVFPKDEPDCVAIVKKHLLELGIAIYEDIKITNIQENQDQITVAAEHNGKTINIANGTHLLVATGRRANVAKLGLENAGVNFSAKGIQIDQQLRTSNKKIYAIGDVVGNFQFTHVANYHAGIVLKNILFKLPAKVNYMTVPWVTYTNPEIAHVGMLAAEAQQQQLAIIVNEWTFTENDRAQAEHQTLGKIKIISNKKGKILGVTIVGSRAGELLLPWIMAIREGKTLRSFTDVIIPYPTFSEISKRGASEFYTPLLFSNKTRWLVKLLKIFG